MKKNVKQILSLLLMIGCSFQLLAQSETFKYNNKVIELNNKVIEHYGKEYIENLKVNNPNLLLYLNYYSTNSYTIEDIGEKIGQSEISRFNLTKNSKSFAKNFDSSNPESFNVLAYAPNLGDQQKVVSINNGSLAIVLKSKKAFIKAFNDYKENLK